MIIVVTLSLERYLKKLFLALFAITFSTAALSQAAPPYVLDDTAVHSLHAKELKRDYQIMVSLPPSYNTSTKRYPVVFVTDATLRFPSRAAWQSG